MNIKRIAAAATALALTLALSACGGGVGSTNLTALKIGIKFDQPGLGLKQGEAYTGLDVDVAKYVAGKLGIHGGQDHVDPGPQRSARNADRNGSGRPGRGDLLDH
ncbi:MAG: hypothetical protein WAS07_10355 [Micropruina sp.]